MKVKDRKTFLELQSSMAMTGIVSVRSIYHINMYFLNKKQYRWIIKAITTLYKLGNTIMSIEVLCEGFTITLMLVFSRLIIRSIAGVLCFYLLKYVLIENPFFITLTHVWYFSLYYATISHHHMTWKCKRDSFSLSKYW